MTPQRRFSDATETPQRGRCQRGDAYTSGCGSRSRPVVCLAVCGQIVAIDAASDAVDPGLWRCAAVDLDGVLQQVSLACLPEARIGDRVLVHVGMALCVVRDDT